MHDLEPEEVKRLLQEMEDELYLNKGMENMMAAMDRLMIDEFWSGTLLDS